MAALVLTGMRVKRDIAATIFAGATAMEESDTFLAIIDEGRLREAKQVVVRLGQIRFGPLDPALKAILDVMNDLDRLERMLASILTAPGWAGVFATS
jgi:hypothetical protein